MISWRRNRTRRVSTEQCLDRNRSRTLAKSGHLDQLEGRQDILEALLPVTH